MFVSSHLVKINKIGVRAKTTTKLSFKENFFIFFNRSLKLSRLVGCDSSERLKFRRNISLLVFSQGSLGQSKVNEAGTWYNARGELDSLI